MDSNLWSPRSLFSHSPYGMWRWCMNLYQSRIPYVFSWLNQQTFDWAMFGFFANCINMADHEWKYMKITNPTVGWLRNPTVKNGCEIQNTTLGWNPTSSGMFPCIQPLQKKSQPLIHRMSERSHGINVKPGVINPEAVQNWGASRLAGYDIAIKGEAPQFFINQGSAKSKVDIHNPQKLV